MEEGKGFEPSEPVTRFSPLAGEPFQPLRHPSENYFKKMEEEQGFEPWVYCYTTVFKTVAFDHSAILPDFLNKKLKIKWLPQLDSNQRPND